VDARAGAQGPEPARAATNAAAPVGRNLEANRDEGALDPEEAAVDVAVRVLMMAVANTHDPASRPSKAKLQQVCAAPLRTNTVTFLCEHTPVTLQ
jgi:hypothetical protein